LIFFQLIHHFVMLLYIYCDCLLINQVPFVSIVSSFLIYLLSPFWWLIISCSFPAVVFWHFIWISYPSLLLHLFYKLIRLHLIVFNLPTFTLLVVNYFMLISSRCIQEIYLEFLTLIVVATPLETYSYPLYHTIVGYFLNQFQIYLAPQNIQCYLCCN